MRTGRKTYVVDLASGNRRTDYVAVGNTAIGFALLLVGALSGWASMVSVETTPVILGLMGIAGVLAASGLPEA